MKLRIGRVVNGLRNGCCVFNVLKKSCVSSSTSTTTRSETKKLSFRENLRLVYYTFFYNEESDSLMAVETLLNPFMSVMNRFVRLFGKVKTKPLNRIIIHLFYFFK